MNPSRLSASRATLAERGFTSEPEGEMLKGVKLKDSLRC